jgi:hypothetical protein
MSAKTTATKTSSAKTPSAKTTLNAKNLANLGAERLAELLMDLGSGDAAIKRRLRLALAASNGSADVAREVQKRLATVAKAQSFIEWPKIKQLAADLELQRRTIVEQVAKIDAGEALALMWQFLALANSVLNRCDDSNGVVGDIFRGAIDELARLASQVKPAPDGLAGTVYAALLENGYGQYDHLIEALGDTLGPKGLKQLKAKFIELSNTPAGRPDDKDRKVIGRGSHCGRIYEDDLQERRRKSAINHALKDIADALGDVDGFIAQYDGKTRAVPAVATEIARRLLAAGRVQEAWTAINAVDEKRPGWIPFEWEATRLAILEVQDRHEEAQSFRWACFERSLSADHLRAYLKRLPDFDDLEAEERALKFVMGVEDHLHALHFLTGWPALDKATKLVERHAGAWDGNRYEYLTPAADALETKYPLAATILRRALIDYTLDHAKSKRYRHAARHLAECASLAAVIGDFGALKPHQAYVAALEAKHGRKAGFWEQVV